MCKTYKDKTRVLYVILLTMYVFWQTMVWQVAIRQPLNINAQ